MSDKTTTIKTEPTPVGTNPLSLPWPLDPHGITSMLKKEGARAVGRINGDPDKFEVFLKTMKVLMKFANEKYAAQGTAREAMLEKDAKRHVRDVETADKARKSSIARLQRQIEHLEGMAPK